MNNKTIFFIIKMDILISIILLIILILFIYKFSKKKDTFYTGFSEELPFRQQYYSNTPIKEWMYQVMV